MALTFFTKSNCRDFITNDEWPPIHQTLINVWGNAGVLSQAAKQV